MVQEEKERQFIEEESTADLSVIEQGNQRRQKLQEKIDDVLLDIERTNEDLFDLSSSLKQRVKINYDMKSLVKSEFIYDVDPELADK